MDQPLCPQKLQTLTPKAWCKYHSVRSWGRYGTLREFPAALNCFVNSLLTIHATAISSHQTVHRQLNAYHADSISASTADTLTTIAACTVPYQTQIQTHTVQTRLTIHAVNTVTGQIDKSNSACGWFTPPSWQQRHERPDIAIAQIT